MLTLSAARLSRPWEASRILCHARRAIGRHKCVEYIAVSVQNNPPSVHVYFCVFTFLCMILGNAYLIKWFSDICFFFFLHFFFLSVLKQNSTFVMAVYVVCVYVRFRIYFYFDFAKNSNVFIDYISVAITSLT